MTETPRRIPPTEKAAIAGVVICLIVLSWLVVVAGPPAPWSGVIDLPSFTVFISIWAVGMMAMMLPSLLPMLFMVASAARRDLENAGSPNRIRRAFQPVLFSIGYFGTWTLTGVAAYFGIALLFRYYLPFANLGAFVGVAAGVSIFLAGIYQLSPLKQKALQACRSPIDFVMTKWRTGPAGGLVMGVAYGSFCTKCCWAFMAVLVVVGAMSLLWMVLFAGVILAEKAAPRGVPFSKGLGLVLMAAGVVLAVAP